MSMAWVAGAVALGIVGGAAALFVIANIIAAIPEWRENQRYRRQYRRNTGRWPW